MLKKGLSLVWLICTALFSGCYVRPPNPKPIYKQTTENNKDYKVEYLFEHKGCKVYRFQDMGSWVYFTNCTGEAMKTDSTTTIRNRTERKQ